MKKHQSPAEAEALRTEDRPRANDFGAQFGRGLQRLGLTIGVPLQRLALVKPFDRSASDEYSPPDESMGQSASNDRRRRSGLTRPEALARTLAGRPRSRLDAGF